MTARELRQYRHQVGETDGTNVVELWRMHRIRKEAARRQVRNSIIAILAVSLAWWAAIWLGVIVVSSWIEPFQ